MMIRLPIMAGLVLLLATMPGLAQEAVQQNGALEKKTAPVDCTIKATGDDLHEEMRAGGWRAVCVKQGNGCALHLRNDAGYLLQLARKYDGGQWRVALTLPQGRQMDVGEGAELMVDDGEPQRIPPEFLEDRAKGRAVAARLEIGDVLMDLLRSGRRLQWRYTMLGGGQEQAEFDLSCLPGLATAVEKKLAQMRAMRQLGK